MLGPLHWSPARSTTRAVATVIVSSHECATILTTTTIINHGLHWWNDKELPRRSAPHGQLSSTEPNRNGAATTLFTLSDRGVPRDDLLHHSAVRAISKRKSATWVGPSTSLLVLPPQFYGIREQASLKDQHPFVNSVISTPSTTYFRKRVDIYDENKDQNANIPLDLRENYVSCGISAAAEFHQENIPTISSKNDYRANSKAWKFATLNPGYK